MIVRTYGRRSTRGIEAGPTRRVLSSSSLDAADTDTEAEDPFAFNDDDQRIHSSSSSFYYTNSNSSLSQQQTLEFQDTPQETYNFTFSSQDSTRFLDSDPSPAPLQLLKPKGEKARKLNDRGRRKEREYEEIGEESEWKAGAATLMETKENGEMMECLDEVEFALDGLKKGLGVRVRRGSLLALLNVCASLHRRRLLKAQGMAKTIIDAIMDISLDDSSSTLAAATLFYILTDDGQDSHLLDSLPSVRFLLKLLKPAVAETVVADRAPSISQKLLALQKDMLVPQYMTKREDSSPTEIVQRVAEILVSCKVLKASNVDSNDMSRPELNPDWVSLLTIEKACLSTISIQDTTGTVRKTGGNFKEKLRDMGGLDAVFELTMKFYSTLEGLVEHVRESKDGKLQCLPLLLKCLKIMENATFLSNENQIHLLRLKGNMADQNSSSSFVKLMVNFIKILSEISLHRPVSPTSSPEAPVIHASRVDLGSELLLDAEQKVDHNGVLFTRFSQECSSSGRYDLDTDLGTSQGSHRISLSTSQGSQQIGPSTSQGSLRTGLSTSQNSRRSSTFESKSLTPKAGETVSWVGNCLIDLVSSSGSGSCSLTSKSSDGRPCVQGDGTNVDMAVAKWPCSNDDNIIIDLEDSQDPFAFDEDDFAPSKWDKPSQKQKGRKKQKKNPIFRDIDDICLSDPMLSQYDYLSQSMLSQEDCPSQPILSQEDNHSQSKVIQEGFGNGERNAGNNMSSDTSCTTTIDEEKSNLVADCLLTAIKVLMNLTNDNVVGCEQIGACGGLETLSFLIARHFPSFSLSSSCGRKDDMGLADTTPPLGRQTEIILNDQELDFLVTILGLLVNLVEKDYDNRSRLAAAEVLCASSSGLKEVRTGVIPLLCSIFLANRGAGEAAEEEQSWDDEEAVLQGEKEAEKMIVEAYAALLLAFLSTESKSTRNSIARYLPDRNLKVLVPVLDRFVTFHMTLNMISPETHEIVSEVIESCRLP